MTFTADHNKHLFNQCKNIGGAHGAGGEGKLAGRHWWRALTCRNKIRDGEWAGYLSGRPPAGRVHERFAGHWCAVLGAAHVYLQSTTVQQLVHVTRDCSDSLRTYTELNISARHNTLNMTEHPVSKLLSNHNETKCKTAYLTVTLPRAAHSGIIDCQSLPALMGANYSETQPV